MIIEKGFFFITDITGYTQFLAQSELDHAKEILDALFESILENIKPPLIVSNTQGDAIITYAPAGAFHEPRQLLDVMEQTYFDFRHQLELMQINTTCDCNACINMSALDLKIFLHYGEYLVQQIGAQTDLQGTDVILAHRLMKNSVFEKFSLLGYGLVTKAALEAMDIDPVAEGMQEYVDHYEHIGEVTAYIHDLRAAWLIERERQRTFVTAKDAVAQASVFVPVPQWVAWDYATNPEFKKLYNDLESIERTDKIGGREKIGSAFHCHHRLSDIEYFYVDYDPPNYVTAKSTGFGFTSLSTTRIVPVEGGSRLELYNGVPDGEYDEAFIKRSNQLLESAAVFFAKIIDDEIQAGSIDPNLVASVEAQKSDFARPGVAEGRYAQVHHEH